MFPKYIILDYKLNTYMYVYSYLTNVFEGIDVHIYNFLT